jgi:hypothetical protein
MPDPTSTSPSTLPHSPETLRQIAEARAALEASMNNIGSSLDHTLRSRAQNLHANSAQLTRQEKDVVRATEGLRKETDKLKKVAEEGQRKVKELGNVQNWAEMLERDFLLLEETLRLVRNGNRPREGGSGDYEGSDWETSRSGTGSWSGSEDGERDDESIAGDLRRGKVLPVEGWGRAEPRPFQDEMVEDTHQVDDEGDTAMDGVEFRDKGKGKEISGDLDQNVHQRTERPEPHSTEQFVEAHAPQHQEPQGEVVGGSSTATTTDTSSSDPSSSSVHTAASTAS